MATLRVFQIVVLQSHALSSTHLTASDDVQVELRSMTKAELCIAGMGLQINLVQSSTLYTGLPGSVLDDTAMMASIQRAGDPGRGSPLMGTHDRAWHEGHRDREP
ncbi:hypothetical protein CBS101457_003428 [Exobasidium rhododendri]|nr:hypothetical protein CBS101457_003428 [Exobasidium rhododendri]